MSTLFNLGSLVLGIISWIIPVVAVKQYRKNRKLINFSVYSFTFCSLALVLQLFEISHFANMNDFASIVDTIGAISLVSIILIIITMVLNFAGSYLCNTENV